MRLNKIDLSLRAAWFIMGKASRRSRISKPVTKYSENQRSDIVRSLLDTLSSNGLTVASEPELLGLLNTAGIYQSEGGTRGFSITINNGQHRLEGTLPDGPSIRPEIHIKKT